MAHSVAVIGVGPDPDTHARDGIAPAYRHAVGYHRLPSCELVGCTAAVPEHADSFARTFGVQSTYVGHRDLLATEAPEIVSVCTPPGTHAEIVSDCATTDGVAAVHCETPMATTWGDCLEVVATCEREGTQLSFHHRHRFALPVREAKRQLEDGAIGELRRIEWSARNLFDAGTHRFDLCDYFNRGSPPLWSLAGVDTDPDNRWYGALNEVMSVAHWEYGNGVQGYASTAEGNRETLVDAYLRLVGRDGTIEIQPENGPPLRIRTGGRWHRIDTDRETIYGREQGWYENAIAKIADTVRGDSRLGPPTQHDRTIDHVVGSLESGQEPLVSGRRALRGTELIYACWESARRRGRVDLPLEQVGNPLEALAIERYGGTDADQKASSTGRSSLGPPDPRG